MMKVQVEWFKKPMRWVSIKSNLTFMTGMSGGLQVDHGLLAGLSVKLKSS